MAVRSIRLGIGGPTAGGSTTIYTVPTGYRTIIKTISAWNTTAAVNFLYVNVFSGATQLGHLIVKCGPNTAVDGAQHANIFQVIDAGETLKVDSDAAGMYWMISGAELLL